MQCRTEEKSETEEIMEQFKNNQNILKEKNINNQQKTNPWPSCRLEKDDLIF
jgi:hypothetical protein